MIAVLTAVVGVAPLLYLHNRQRYAGNRRLTAWLGSARDVVTDTLEQDEELLREYGGLGAMDQITPNQKRNILHSLTDVAEALAVGETPSADPLLPGLLNSPPRVLITDKVTCMFCLDDLRQPHKLQREKELLTVTLITRSFTQVKATLAVAHCFGCGADYHPDRIVRRNGRELRQFYLYDARYMRISKPAMLWVDRTIAVGQAQAILQHQTFSGYANHFNKTYGPFGANR